MPKLNGVSKTYSFDAETIEKLRILCSENKRTQTNMIEVLIENEYKKRSEMNGE